MRRSKQEVALAYLRAFDKKRAVTEREIYKTQLKLFSYKRTDEIFEPLKALLTEEQRESDRYFEVINAVFKYFREPTESPNIHSGNLVSVFKRNKFIHRFKDKNNHWRYYLH